MLGPFVELIVEGVVEQLEQPVAHDAYRRGYEAGARHGAAQILSQINPNPAIRAWGRWSDPAREHGDRYTLDLEPPADATANGPEPLSTSAGDQEA